MGFGDDVDIVKMSSQKNTNIHFHQAVSQSEITNVTSSADVGLCLIKNDSLSYEFCLPNKVFEYIHSGIPILSSNFTELSELILSNNFGWVTNPNLEDIYKQISLINKNEIDIKSNEINLKKHKFDWRNEELEYLNFFNS